MLTCISFQAANFHKAITTMKTILTGVILAALLAAAGCSQTSVEQPASTGSNGAETSTTNSHNDSNMGPGHMPGGPDYSPGHQGGREHQ